MGFLLRRALYAGVVFWSALLLLLVQPILTKAILPWFGGSASVWTTSMLFFQVLLLAGYLYAHLLQSLPMKAQVTGTARTASGQPCDDCTIEVFVTDGSAAPAAGGDDAGEGQTFVGAAESSASGAFAVAISGVVPGQWVTDTTTDDAGNTSEFSLNVQVVQGSTALWLPLIIYGGPTPSHGQQ